MSREEKSTIVTSIISSTVMAIICFTFYHKRMQSEYERGFTIGVEACKKRGQVINLPGVDSITITGAMIQPWISK